jgi:DNA-binding transcriptional MerR regulator
MFTKTERCGMPAGWLAEERSESRRNFRLQQMPPCSIFSEPRHFPELPKMIADYLDEEPAMPTTPAGQTPRGGVIAAKTERTTQDQRTFTIGEMAREFNVTFRTLRFYETRGLLQPLRVGSNRIYRSTDRTRLQMILKGKQLGFTLTEIAEMFDQPTSPATRELGLNLELQRITDQLGHLEQQRLHLDEAIAELRAAHSRLSAG